VEAFLTLAKFSLTSGFLYGSGGGFGQGGRLVNDEWIVAISFDCQEIVAFQPSVEHSEITRTRFALAGQ
jgi:hypothetical protein